MRNSATLAPTSLAVAFVYAGSGLAAPSVHASGATEHAGRRRS